MSTAISRISANSFPIRSLVAIVAVVLFGLCIRPFMDAKDAQMLPCRIGSYWIYDTVSREQVESGATETVKAKNKLTVIDSIERPGIDVALVERKDLYGREPVSFTIRVVFDNNRFYEYDVSDEERANTWSTLKSSVAGGEKPEFPDESSLQMELSSKVGTTWDQEGTVPDRTDNMYCWCVEKIRSVPASTEIAGVRLPQNTSEYTIAFRTCPDHQIRTFVPGIGFVHLQYRHHGTICDSDEQLVEFHSGS